MGGAEHAIGCWRGLEQGQFSGACGRVGSLGGLCHYVMFNFTKYNFTIYEPKFDESYYNYRDREARSISCLCAAI